MVFNGRPSTACHACRKTRLKVSPQRQQQANCLPYGWLRSASKECQSDILTATVFFTCQCDRVPAGCSQCKRKHRTCPGYVNASELRLRDETDLVARKIRKAEKGRDSSSREAIQEPQLRGGAEEPTSDSTPSRKPRPPKIYGPSYSLSSAIDDIAIHYFMSSFIIASPFQGYLPSLFAVGRLAEDALTSAVYATAHATFALRTGDARHLDRGRNNYAVALCQTNAALRDPSTAVLDETLAAILLLGLFESAVFPGKKSPEEWTAHTFGALRLLQLRGMRQFKSSIAAQLFAHTGSKIRVSCVQREMKVPAEFQSLFEKSIPFLNPKDPSNRLGPVLDKMAAIRATLFKFTLADLVAAVDEAAALEIEVRSIISDSEKDLLPTVQEKAETSSRAYLGSSYQYPNERVAKVCNSIRMIQLSIHELLWRGSARIESVLEDVNSPSHRIKGARDITYYSTLKQVAARVSEGVCKQVLASVPTFTEQGPDGQKFSPSARTLIWPLNLIHRSVACPSESREYSRVLLNELGRDLYRLHPVNPDCLVNEPGSLETW